MFVRDGPVRLYHERNLQVQMTLLQLFLKFSRNLFAYNLPAFLSSAQNIFSAARFVCFSTDYFSTRKCKPPQQVYHFFMKSMPSR